MSEFWKRIRELEDAVRNTVRYGTVASLDTSAPVPRVTVKLGPIVTAPIQWVCMRAGSDGAWWPPTVGEQVVVLSPAGDLNQAVALPSLYQTGNPPPSSDPNKVETLFSDGTSVIYDRSAHTYTLNVAAGGTVNIVAAGPINLTATGKLTLTGSEIDLVGPVKANSTIDANGAITGGEVQAGTTVLTTHKHIAVQTGGGVSGPPQ